MIAFAEAFPASYVVIILTFWSIVEIIKDILITINVYLRMLKYFIFYEFLRKLKQHNFY